MRQIISFLSIAACTCYLLFGIYFVLRDKINKTSMLFLCLCLSFSIWSLSKAVIASYTDTHLVIIWTKIGFIGALCYEIFILKLFLKISNFDKKFNQKKIIFLYISLWIIPLIFIYMNIQYNAIENDFPFGFWYIGLHVLVEIYNMISIFIICHWIKTTKLKREKKQGQIILITGLLTIIITIICDFYCGMIGLPSLTPVLILIWVGSLLYAVHRYRFMGISNTILTKNILEQSEDIIIVLNSENKIILLNSNAKSILKASIDDHAKNILKNYDEFQNQLKRISKLNQTITSFFVKSRNNNYIPVITSLSTLYDSFGDHLGTLIIGRSFKEKYFLKEKYGLTSREIEITSNLISGLSNIEISNALFISTNTLKSHISNIYNKMGIDNKIKLYNLIRETNIKT